MIQIITKTELIWPLLLLNSIAIVSTKRIDCYVCDDCDVLDDCLLQICPKEYLTPEPPTVPPTTNSAFPTRSSTTERTTKQTSITHSSTKQTSTTSSTTKSSTIAEKTSIKPSTTPKPEPSTSIIPSIPEFDTTTPSSSTRSEVTDSSEYTDQTTNDLTTEAPSTRVTSEETTVDPTIEPTSFHWTSSPAYNFKSFLMKDESYHCYSLEIIKDNRRQKKRGCVGVPEDKSACQVLASKFNCSLKNCKICSEDRCNGAVDVMYSLTVYVSIIVVSYLV